MAQLELRGVGKRYGQTEAVIDFNLTVADGEFVTLLGPSGCGKTTTLRMVAGFIQPTTGEILLDERAISTAGTRTHLPPEQRNMGMVFQSYAVWPHKNVFENIAYPLRLRRVNREAIRQRVSSVLEMVNLDGLGERYPNQLSGGQQQRVALARALVMEPGLLLLDEPLSNLDAKLRERMRFEIVEIQRRLKITVLYVTHDQAEAMAMSDRIVVMRDGRIQQVGASQTVYTQPANAFVADFVGTANILPVTITRSDEHAVTAVTLGDSTTSFPLHGMVQHHVTVGQDVQLVIRPEHVELHTTYDGSGLQGVVTSRLFLGDHIDYQVAVGESVLRARAPFDSPYTVEDRVGLAFKSVQLLPLKQP